MTSPRLIAILGRPNQGRQQQPNILLLGHDGWAPLLRQVLVLRSETRTALGTRPRTCDPGQFTVDQQGYDHDRGGELRPRLHDIRRQKCVFDPLIGPGSGINLASSAKRPKT